MKAYSKDLRIRVLDALDRGTPRADVVRLLGVSSPTITRWRRRRRETGSLAASPRPGPPGPKRAALRAGLLPQLAAHPDATLEQHCTRWEAARGVRVSPATMSRAITRDLGWPRKRSP
jgi:transposase